MEKINTPWGKPSDEILAETDNEEICFMRDILEAIKLTN